MRLHRSARLRSVAVGLVLAAVAAAFIIALTGQGGETPAPGLVLQGVSLEDLARDGLILTPPDAAVSADVTADQARDFAAGKFGGAVVREVVLAHLVSKNDNPPLDRLVWVVNLDPDTVIVPEPTEMDPAETNTYALTFIDANTGAHLFTEVASEPTEGSQASP